MIGVRYQLPLQADELIELLQLALLLFAAMLSFGLIGWTEFCVGRASHLRSQTRSAGQTRTPTQNGRGWQPRQPHVGPDRS